MENIEWHPVLYNGIETNVEVTECGKVRRVPKDWYGNGNGSYKIVYGEIKFKEYNKFKIVSFQRKGLNKTQSTLCKLMKCTFKSYVKPKIKRKRKREQNRELPTGVVFRKLTKKYRAQINFNKKYYHLGYFDTPEEASQTYQNKLKEIEK